MSDIRGLFNRVPLRADVLALPENEQPVRLLFHCPGCKQIHGPTVGPGDGPRWTWNGDYEKPVFSPSLLVRWTHHEPPVTHDNLDEWKRQPWEQHPVNYMCHSFIGCNGAQPGEIVFLNDCTHALAGQTVPLAPWDDAAW